MPILNPGLTSNTREETQIEVLEAVQNIDGRHIISSGLDNAAISEWDFTNVDTSSIIQIETQYSQRIIALTLDPAVPNVVSWMEKVGELTSPATSEAQITLNQRTRTDSGIYALADTSVLVPDATSYTIASIAQAGTIVTIVLTSPFELPLGTLVSITGVSDNRVCYQDAPVSLVTEDKLTLQINTQSGAAVPSITVAAITTGGTLQTDTDVMMRAANGASLYLVSNDPLAAEMYVRRGGSHKLSAAPSQISGNRRFAVSNSNMLRQANASAVSVAASSEYRIDIEPGIVTFSDRAADVNTAYSVRSYIESTAPSASRSFKKLVGGVRSRAACSPIANIVSVTRTSNQVVFTLDIPAATRFALGQYVQVYGVFNQTLFADNAFVVAGTSITAVSGNTITIPWTGTDGTSYGGFLCLPVGQVNMSGLQNRIISAAVDTNGRVTLTGSAAWTCTSPDVVRIQGVRNNTTGADLGIDGMWKVSRISATTTLLILEPLLDYNGVRKSPVVTPFTTTGCGGGAILATTIRVHSWRAYSKPNSQEVKIYGQGLATAAQSVPVYIAGGAVTQGAALTAVGGSNGWPVSPGLQQIVDISSGVTTVTNTSGGFNLASTSSGAAAFQLVCQVTAVSGTNPTLDLRIEVTDDNTNWYVLYDLPRITAIGIYRTPELRTDARTYRLVHTVTGTSPSFTRGVTRNNLPFQQPEPRCQIFDRTVVLTTVGSTTQTMYCDGPADLQLWVSIGAATTPPSLQLQSSEDNGATWVSIGNPLAAVANSTVRTLLTAEYARHVRAIVTSAGVGVTANYVLIKAVGG